MNFNLNQDAPPVIKAVLLGDSEVGKTSLCSRFCSGVFNQSTQATISASCSRSELTIDDQKISFCIWDTAGQERFRSISPIYYRGAHVAIVVMSLTTIKTVEVASSWIKELRIQGPPDIPIVLFGNKVDLIDSRAIPKESAIQFAQEQNAPYFETSALSGESIVQAFTEAARLGLKYSKEYNNSNTNSAHAIIEKNEDSLNPQPKSRCC